ncbi:MAG: hypothetical protein CVT49_13780 [candidate division Zixibacteria bacterium HGW-Zixibacteria-1]|nr:MAG: hypothetical protein CVT49_13780 [candidate division Zixibacteria bacterium HGW-Zixibacteria-1]
MRKRVVSVFDVAKYIVRRHGSVSAMKLQKLVYYSQAWALVWDEIPLFSEKIEAWISGPVVPELFGAHKGKYLINSRDLKKGNSENLSDSHKKTIDAVLDYYGDKNSQWLSDLTHMEGPWRKARKGLASDERGSQEITQASMQEYYSSLSL